MSKKEKQGSEGPASLEEEKKHPTSEETPKGPEKEKHAPFMDHLQELANRLKWSIVAVIVGFFVAYFLSEPIFNALTKPLITAFEGDERLHFSSPTEPFFTYLTIALVGGIALAAPFIFYNLWAFVSPGLYSREKKMVLPFLGTSVVFFFGGIAFGYFIVLPLGFQFLLDYAYNQPANFSIIQTIAQWLGTEADPSKLDLPVAALQPTIMMQDYISLVTKLLLAFGIIFEMPLFIYFLAKIGLITHKHLLKFFRYFVVLAFLIGALLTPPDVITQMLMAGPMLVMYTSSILVAYIVTKNKARRKAKQQRAEKENKSASEKQGDFSEGTKKREDAAGYSETWVDAYESKSTPEVDPLDELEEQLPKEGWDDKKHL